MKVYILRLIKPKDKKQKDPSQLVTIMILEIGRGEKLLILLMLALRKLLSHSAQQIQKKNENKNQRVSFNKQEML